MVQARDFAAPSRLNLFHRGPLLIFPDKERMLNTVERSVFPHTMTYGGQQNAESGSAEKGLWQSSYHCLPCQVVYAFNPGTS